MRTAQLFRVAFVLLVASLFLALVTLCLPQAFAAQRMAIVRGTIIDQDGKPIEGVDVIIEYWNMGPRLTIGATGAGDRESINESSRKQSGNRRQTREDGTFSYPSLDAGAEYRVRFEKDGYIPREEKHVFHVAANDMGTMVMVSGDVERARDAYERGFSAYESGDLPGAIEPMLEVVDVFGDSDVSDQMLVVALGVLGQAYLQQNQPAEAQGALERLQSIEPTDSATTLLDLGRVYAMQGQIPLAIESFERAVEAEPDNANGRFLLGYALQLSGQATTAIPHLRASIEIQPDFPPAHQSLGLALADTGANAEAIEHLEAYLQAMPNAPDAAQMRAKIAELRSTP